MMYLIVDNDRWGRSMNIVRASSQEEAIQLACPGSRRFEITELPEEGASAIVWSHDESPDTPRD